MNLKNLSKLADFIEGNVDQEKFNMECFRSETGSALTYKDLVENKNCGTVGCVLGWAPFSFLEFAAIQEDSNPDGSFSWFSYCERVFGISSSDDQWDFLFSGEWKDIDNSVKGAVERMRHLCKNPDEEMVHFLRDYADESDEGLPIPKTFPLPDGCDYV